jgi:hypothetical protein
MIKKYSDYPTKGSPPTGIFSSKGKQKLDSTADAKHKDVQTYALGKHDEVKPKPGRAK